MNKPIDEGQEITSFLDGLASDKTGSQNDMQTANLTDNQQEITDFSKYISDQGGLAKIQGSQQSNNQPGEMPADRLLQTILNMYQGGGQ